MGRISSNAPLVGRLLSTFAACLFLVVPSLAASPQNVDWQSLHDVEGKPLELNDTELKVVCFLGVECPLARLYGQRLSQLGQKFAPQGVRMIGINSNPQDSADDVRGYIEDLKVSIPIIKDTDQSLARQMGATRTPEVMVLDSAGVVCYQGRIDDQYEPGISRAGPTQHDLRNALEALVRQEPVPVAATQAVGCLITFIKPQERPKQDEELLTFTRDVAPVLNKHCVECHRPGEIGPFSLTDYDEVVGWGEMMLEVIDQKRMPPWHADPRYGKFVGARHMPAEDVNTLAAWVAQGMAEGDPEDLPATPEKIAGWQMATPPDEQFDMRGRPFEVPADGIVEYQYYVVDPQWKEDRWIRAAQVVPGNPSVVHHAIVFVRKPDGTRSRGIGWLGGYVPGQRAWQMPEGHARFVPAGSKLVFQMHYTPNGREALDTTKVGVWFVDEEDVTHEVTTRVALNHHFEIPPGVAAHSVDLKMRHFTRGSTLLGASPHMHLRGKSFRLEARRKQGRETLLHVPEYDFNWQHLYGFAKPIPLDDISALEMQVGFDNSAENPTNPDPNQFVTWGDQTWQEMAVAFFDVAHPRSGPHEIVRHESNDHKVNEEERRARIDQQVEEFLAEMDTDGDGVVLREEVPDSFRLFGFDWVDHNRDRRIERSEIEAEVSQRL